METTEILIHITAPSRATDDKHYRELAQAYLDFEPVIRVDLAPEINEAEDVEFSGQLLGSSQLSFESVWDNLDSPRLRWPTAPIASEDVKDPESQQSEAPPSVVSDSQPYNDISIASLCSPTRVLEHFLQTRSSKQASSQSLPEQLHGANDTTISTERISDSQPPLPTEPKITSLEVPSSLDSTSLVSTPCPQPHKAYPKTKQATAYSSPSPSRGRKRGAPEMADKAIQDPEWLIIPSSRASSDPPPAKRKRGRDGDEGRFQTLPRSASDMGPRAAQHQPAATAAEVAGERQTFDEFEIWPPEPEVSCDILEPESLVTELLAQVVKDAGMHRFGPKEEVRPVRSFERGYWLIDTSAWDDWLKEQCWLFLAQYISRGSAGWGVWCKRDVTKDWVRLYTFGHIAPHTYFLLYLGSLRKILYTGATWHGGDGEIIITIKPRKGVK